MGKTPKLEMETKLGTIMIKESGFTAEGYPGFVFSIKRDGREVDIALFEVDQSDPNEDPECKVHVWAPGHEDPVFDQALNAKMLDRMFYEEI